MVRDFASLSADSGTVPGSSDVTALRGKEITKELDEELAEDSW